MKGFWRGSFDEHWFACPAVRSTGLKGPPTGGRQGDFCLREGSGLESFHLPDIEVAADPWPFSTPRTAGWTDRFGNRMGDVANLAAGLVISYLLGAPEHYANLTWRSCLAVAA